VEEQFAAWEAGEQESHKIAIAELESQLVKVSIDFNFTAFEDSSLKEDLHYYFRSFICRGLMNSQNWYSFC
jgi:hypothetical protein